MLIDLYNGIAKSTNMLVRREKASDFYFEPFKKCEYTYVYKKNGIPRGFVSYTVNRAENRVLVKEIYFYDRDALMGLLGFLRTYDGNLKYLQFTKLPVCTPIIDVIGEQKGSKVTLSNGDSGRVLNLEKVLSLNVYPKERGSFSFLSADDVPGCSGIYDVEYENGKGEIFRRDSGEYDFSVSPAAASRIFLSSEGLTGYALSYMTGFEKKRDLSDFIRAFPKKNSDFNKGF